MNSVEDYEISNCDNVTVPVGPHDPPLQVTQPFNGQWIQVDITATPLP
jgi:hypothetical protein